MRDFEKTKRTTLKRLHDRGHFDRETVYAILDEGDYGDPVWAGVVPVSLVCGAAYPDPQLSPGIEAPANIPKAGPFKTGA